MKTLKDYFKGKTSNLHSTNNIELQELEKDRTDMSSSTYWFGETAVEDPWLPSLSKSQRIYGFFILLGLGLFCFFVAALLTPVLILKIRKFVLLYTMGSFFTIGSFALLWGPWNHLKHIFSFSRLPFTCSYFGSMAATLYTALSLHSTTLTLLFASMQMFALLWYMFSYIPGGTTGMKFFTKLCAAACTKTIAKTLPV